MSEAAHRRARSAWIALVGVLLWLPQYAEGFWLQTGLFAMSAAIGAIGLTLLVGVTGQLSLAHAFFVARRRLRLLLLRRRQRRAAVAPSRTPAASGCRRCWPRCWRSSSPAWPARCSARSPAA